MNETERRVAIFALQDLSDRMLSNSHLVGPMAFKTIEYMIGDGIPGIYEKDVYGVRDIIASTILELEEELEEGDI